VRRFKRVHSTGTAAELTQHSEVWRIQITLRKGNRNPITITGYVERSLASAKEWADKEIAKYGHVCTSACKDWLEVR